jgi:1,4-dihydroxy-2-naphthoate octaprenyltransferase
MNQIDPYLQAARLRTLPLSLSSTIVGNAMAYYFGVFHLSIFLMTLGVVILLQILSNYANDLGDSEKGTAAYVRGNVV